MDRSGAPVLDAIGPSPRRWTDPDQDASEADTQPLRGLIDGDVRDFLARGRSARDDAARCFEAFRSLARDPRLGA